MQHLRSSKTDQASSITGRHEHDQPPIFVIAPGVNLSGNGNPSQGAINRWLVHTRLGAWKVCGILPKADDGIGRGIIPAIMLGFAELSDAHRSETDVAAAGKAKNGTVYDDKWDPIASREPQA